LLAQVDQHRSAQTEERLTQILTEAAKEFTAQQWGKAKDLYGLARTRFGSTSPYKAHESKINDMIARCDEQLSRLREEQALVTISRARFEYRDKKWSAAASLLDQVFNLFGDTQAFARQRRDLEQMRAECDRNRNK
jgi:hypothetical protein